jgi:DNA replication and repair protein RecF
MAIERGSRKKASLNGLGMPRASDLLGRLPSVCISVEDMSIVRGEPAERRLFLDLELSSLYPGYLRHLSVYKRALEQRNALLRQAREIPVQDYAFEVWEDQLAVHGSAIREMRTVYLDQLSPYATENHRWMGQGEVLELAPETKDEFIEETSLRANLAATRGQDIARGSTTLGPHRDDLRILIHGVEARLFGSQGQQRTSAIAVKLATLEFAHQHRGFPPVLLLDDILSDLDERRRALLVELVSARAQQAILTCTEASAAGPDILSKAKCFQIKAGTVMDA